MHPKKVMIYTNEEYYNNHSKQIYYDQVVFPQKRLKNDLLVVSKEKHQHLFQVKNDKVD